MPGEKEVYPEIITPSPDEQEWYVVGDDGKATIYQSLTPKQLAEFERLKNDKSDQFGRALLYLAERDEARLIIQQVEFLISEAMKRIENENIDAAYASLKSALEWIDGGGEER